MQQGDEMGNVALSTCQQENGFDCADSSPNGQYFHQQRTRMLCLALERPYRADCKDLEKTAAD